MRGGEASQSLEPWGAEGSRTRVQGRQRVGSSLTVWEVEVALHQEGDKTGSLQHASSKIQPTGIRARCFKIIKVLEKAEVSCFYCLGLGKVLLRSQ